MTIPPEGINLESAALTMHRQPKRPCYPLAPLVQVEIALELKRQYSVTGVWIEDGHLFYRYGYQGYLEKLCWYDAAVLTGYQQVPERPKVERKPPRGWKIDAELDRKARLWLRRIQA